jgi:3-phosphoshikimate 1-carboxyvinyltransferase
MLIQPITHPLNASVRVPGSKSLTNRALLIAALADGQTRIENALFSDDSRYFADALQTLGFDLRLDENAKTMTVTGQGGRIPAERADLFIGNAGTAARFLCAFLTLGHGQYTLDGEPRMRERPIGDLVETLEALGAKIIPILDNSRIDNSLFDNSNLESSNNEYRKTVCPPILIQASGLTGGCASIAGDISSQFLSALLMVAPYAQNPVELSLSTELNSKPYVEMTMTIMKEFGIVINSPGYAQFTIHPGRYQAQKRYIIESDASAASYFFAAPLICGGTVRVENISRQSKQGDIQFLDILAQMGATIEETDHCILVTGHSILQRPGRGPARHPRHRPNPGSDCPLRRLPDPDSRHRLGAGQRNRPGRCDLRRTDPPGRDRR